MLPFFQGSPEKTKVNPEKPPQLKLTDTSTFKKVCKSSFFFNEKSRQFKRRNHCQQKNTTLL
jgi:hypothetical protein